MSPKWDVQYWFSYSAVEGKERDHVVDAAPRLTLMTQLPKVLLVSCQDLDCMVKFPLTPVEGFGRGFLSPIKRNIV